MHSEANINNTLVHLLWQMQVPEANFKHDAVSGDSTFIYRQQARMQSDLRIWLWCVYGV